MGQVYRAVDTRLGRDVALKVLLSESSRDTARFRRFEAEARSTAALSHRNIVSVYDVGEEEGGTPYIVSELMPGGTLTDLLARAPLPSKKILDLAIGIAEGLAAAHGQGIVHRDLKPDNILMAADGTPKIADFGLAKHFRPASDPEGSHLTTLPDERTKEGTVLGTVGYMSPEQAQGLAVDFRSDQFSFGSILYEMATGKRAFQRASSVQTLAAIVQEEPEPIESINSRIPAPLTWVIERCLAKDPSERYASTLDLARELVNLRVRAPESRGEEPKSPAARRRRKELTRWGLAASALLVGLAAGLVIRGREGRAPGSAPLMRLNLAFPEGESPVLDPDTTNGLAMSPDGSRLVYVGWHTSGRALYVRSLDQLDAKLIPGTEGAMNPFFSPDGEWVGFGTDRDLKKVSLSGGKPLTLCDTPIWRGASWGADGTIVFSPSGNTSLLRISEKGGKPSPLTTLNPGKGEATHRWPHFLPGGKMALFTIHDLSGDYEKARIGVVSTETGQTRILLEGGSDARYLPGGYLIYLRAATLFGVRFDPKRLEVIGAPVPVLDGVFASRTGGVANYAFSETGSLVYRALDPRELERELAWVDRKGGARVLTDARRLYLDLRFSPDGRRLAVVAGEPGSRSRILIYDLARNSFEQLISGSLDGDPVWSPDGKRIAFSSDRSGSRNLFVVPADLSAPPEQLTNVNTWPWALSWFPDGRKLLVTDSPSSQSRNLAELSLEDDRKPRILSASPSQTLHGRLSPDGKWMTYDSNESGRFEVYVAPYPGPGGRLQISSNGGSEPVWSPDGREVVFRSDSKLMVAAVETHPELRAAAPKMLFETPFEAFDISPDGQHFVIVRSAHPDLPPPPLTVVLGWSGDLERRLNVRK